MSSRCCRPAGGRHIWPFCYGKRDKLPREIGKESEYSERDDADEVRRGMSVESRLARQACGWNGRAGQNAREEAQAIGHQTKTDRGGKGQADIQQERISCCCYCCT